METINTKKAKITLIIDEDLWNQFKEGLPRTTSLNDGVVELIRKEVQRK